MDLPESGGHPRPGAMEPPEYEATHRLEERHWWFVGMRRLTASLLDSQPPPNGGWERVLDAGCGTGGNLQLLRRYGPEVIGVDVSPVALGLCRSRGAGPALQASVDALPFADETFDAAACFDVLNHVGPGADELALREFQRVLRPGGLLMVRVPAYQWLWSSHDEIIHAWHRYTSKELASKMRGAGFRVLRLTYANTFLFPLAAARRLLQRLGPGRGRTDLVPVPTFVNWAFLKVLESEAWLVRHVRLPFGLSVVALGQKSPSREPT